VGAPTGRVYYGDLRLWREGIAPEERYGRILLQEFQGIDQARVLVIAASANAGLDLEVRCLGFPNPSAKNRRGWIAVKRALRVAMDARIHRTDPVVWIEDDTTRRVVTSYGGSPAVNVAGGHPHANGDVVLIRRLGVGLFSLGTVMNATGTAFDVASVLMPGLPLHAIQAGDEILLVEAYWPGMVWRDFEPRGEQGWYAKDVAYSFRGSGSASYARTTAAVGT
jgi:hypothetical protein